MNYDFCKWGADGKMRCVETFEQQDPHTYDITIKLVDEDGNDIYSTQLNNVGYNGTDFLHRISLQGLNTMQYVKLVIIDMTDYQNFNRLPLQLLFKYNQRMKPGRIVFSSDIPLNIYSKRKSEMIFTKHMIDENGIAVYFDLANMRAMSKNISR